MHSQQTKRLNFSRKAFLVATALLLFAVQGGNSLLTAPGQPTEGKKKDSGQAVDSRIQTVQVYTDQALITRTGEVSLARGRTQLRFPDLPAGLSADSVQLRINPPGGVRILEVRTETLHKKIFRGAEAKEADARLLKAQSVLRGLTDEYRALEREAQFLRSIEVGRVRSDSKTERRVDAGRWEETLNFIRSSLAENNRRTAGLLDRVDRAREELTVALTIAERFRSGQALSRREVHVLAESDATRRVTVQLDYLVNQAGWFPNYTARVETAASKPGQGQVRLLAYALVRNNTGEDWANVDLKFSAADPADSAALPPLLSWRIRARLEPSEPGRPSGGSRARRDAPSPAAERAPAREKRKIRVREERARGGRGPVSADEQEPADAKPATTESIVQQRVQSNVARARGYYSQNQGEIRDDRAKKRSQAVEQNLRELTSNTVQQERAYRGGRYQEALEKSQQVLRNIDRLDPQYRGLFKNEEKQARDIRLRSLRLIEQQDLMRNLVPPRSSARGYDYRYSAVGREFVRTDGTFHRVLIGDVQLPAALVYETAPERRPLAFLTGTVRYAGDAPLLAGPMAVFHNTDYVGAAHLSNTSARETFSLHLGNDPTISITRTVEEFRTKSGILTEQYDFKRTIKLVLENRRKQATTLVVLDRVPVPADQQITVSTPVFSQAPEKDSRKDHGLYRFRVELAPGEKRELTIQYTLSHPVNVLPRYSERSYPNW